MVWVWMWMSKSGKTVTEKLEAIRRSNGPVSLQPGSIPDLCLYCKSVELYSPCAELHPNGCAAIVVELIFGEAR